MRALSLNRLWRMSRKGMFKLSVARPSLPRVTLTRLGAPLLEAQDASSFISRWRGLHGLPRLCGNEALVIRPCKSIHTFGMKYSIDVAFMSTEGRVLKLATLAPGAVAWCAGAQQVVEMSAGTVGRLQLEPGHVLVSSPEVST